MPDFGSSWNGKPGRKYQTKKEQIKQKLASLAKCIYRKYFKEADLTPHGSMKKLNMISETLENAAKSHEVCIIGLVSITRNLF